MNKFNITQSQRRKFAKKILVPVATTLVVCGALVVIASSNATAGPDHTVKIQRLTVDNTRILQDIVEAQVEYKKGEEIFEEGRVMMADGEAFMTTASDRATELRNKKAENETIITNLSREMAGLALDQ